MPKIMYRNTAYGEVISDSSIKYKGFGINNTISAESIIDNCIQGDLSVIECTETTLSKRVSSICSRGKFYIVSFPYLHEMPNDSTNLLGFYTLKLYLPSIVNRCSIGNISGVKHLDFPSLETILHIYGCDDLLTFYAPILKSIYGISGCDRITHIYLPQCTSFAMSGSSRGVIAERCTNLQTVNLPMFTDSDLIRAFDDNPNLQLVDFGSLTTMNSASSGSYSDTFYNCNKFQTLIIRTPTLCTLSTINVFRGCPFASGKAGGTLYVPQALISSYQNATNWKTILGYPNNKILPLEGSPYETPSTSYDHY